MWGRSWNGSCLVAWFWYQLIAKPGNKTASVVQSELILSTPNLHYTIFMSRLIRSSPTTSCISLLFVLGSCLWWVPNDKGNGWGLVCPSVDGLYHDYVIKWKHFPCYWSFVREIHQSPVNSSHKGQWHGALMFSLICTWMNGSVNNVEAGDLRRHHAHYDITVMLYDATGTHKMWPWVNTLLLHTYFFLSLFEWLQTNHIWCMTLWPVQ